MVEAYSELGADLSQGDIIRDVPTGLLHSPVVVCRPDQPNEPQSKAFCAHVEHVSRGGRAYNGDRREFVHLDSQRGLAMVVWDDCELDKFKNLAKPEKAFAGVVPVFPLSRLNAQDRPRVLAFERHAFYPLLAAPTKGIAEDSYADLRLVVPVKVGALTNRVVTLSPMGRAALTGHMFRFFTGKELPSSAACPNCGTDIAKTG